MDQFGRLEEYSNTGRVNSFDHYIPQFILRSFRIADTGQQKGKVFEYSFEDNQIKETGIGTSAGSISHDSFKDKTGVQSDYVSRKVFSENLELRSSKIINQLNKETGEPILTFLEESTLSVFLAHQFTRVPAFYAAVEKFILYLKDQSKLTIPDIGNIEFLETRIVNNRHAVTIDDLLNFRTNLHMSGARNHIGLLTRLIANEIAEKIYRGNLHILDIPSQSNESFVLSDNPVVLLDLDRKEVLRYPAWWEISKKELLIFMPISPTRCIFYSKRRRKGSVVENENLDFVQVVNFGQYLNASNSVFSNNEQVLQNHLAMYRTEINNLKIF